MTEPSEKDKPKEPFIEKFFGNYFNWFITKARWFIFVIVIIWTGIAIWRAT